MHTAPEALNSNDPTRERTIPALRDQLANRHRDILDIGDVNRNTATIVEHRRADLPGARRHSEPAQTRDTAAHRRVSSTSRRRSGQ